MVRLVRRIAGFSTLPFLAAILPLIALPIVSRAAVPEEWVALNVGLGVGGFAGAIGLGGWNVLGTPLVAMAGSADERRTIYARSFSARVLVVAVVALIAAGISVAAAPSASWATAAVFAAAGAANGLEVNWYAVGISSPRVIVLFEILPRAVATALAIVVVRLTGQVFWYGVLLIVAVIAGVVAFHLSLYRRVLPPLSPLRLIAADISRMRSLWGVEASGNLYANAPVPISSVITGVGAASAYASSDKLYRYGTLGVGAVGNAVQGWVLEVGDERRRERNLVGIAIMLAVGVLGWLFLAFGGVWFSSLLFGSELAGDGQVFVILGAAFFAMAVRTPLIRNVIVPAHKDRMLLVLTFVAALVGVGLMVAFGAWLGAAGVALGFAASELIMLTGCIVLTARVGLAAHTPRTLGE